ncbi:MAG: phosphoribosylanthranilate isomerase [Dysgonamonadaceae bacterium]|jgi:phosphoribosylanthranilate isomerase|nr:phosphoribosylanthranilate isomerase [Dysgonamonadaceae bacterium]
MKIKVCGMTNAENIWELVRLPIDWMGMIFYEPSCRYAGNLPADAILQTPLRIRKVGVFVNASETEIREKVKRYDLQAVQLHGNESPNVCRRIKEQGVIVLKAFAVSDEKDLNDCALYNSEVCDYFLFDTKTPHHGGSGNQFEWQLLESYSGKTPFFLSGGISAADADRIKAIRHPLLCGVDLNSRFETAPGIKNIDLLQTFINALQQ